MQKAGGIIALVAGIFGIFAAVFTLAVGGLGAGLEAEGASTVVGLGWGGVAFSFLTIILGAVALGARGRLPGILLMICGWSNPRRHHSSRIHGACVYRWSDRHVRCTETRPESRRLNACAK